MSETRAEHMAWAKARAIAYCDAGDPHNAFASINSDLRKHPDTAGHNGIELGLMMILAGQLESAAQMREWIEGMH